MEKKRNRLFTHEDRQKVFQKITQDEHKKITTRPFMPLVIIAAMLIVSALLVSHYLKPQQQAAEVDAIEKSSESALSTVLISVKDSTGRVPINVLLVIDEHKNRLNAMSLPRDTKVQVGMNQAGEPILDKLTFAYSVGNEQQSNLQLAVEQLLAISIDEVILVDLKDFVKNVGMVEYSLSEPLTVRAIEQAKYELKSGKQFLDGEQLASLFVMATTNYFEPTEKQAITQLFLSELLFKTAWQQYMVKNIPVLDDLTLDGLNTEVIDQKFYYTFSDEVRKDMKASLYSFAKEN